MKPTYDASGRRILVTGASRGIGAVIARRYAAAGAEVHLGYLQQHDAATAVRDAIVGAGGRAELAQTNLTVAADVRDCCARIGAGGPLHAIVHAAALGSFKPLMDVRANQWALTMETTAHSLLTLVQAARGVLAPGASITSLSSIGAQRVLPDYGAIGVAKAALEAVTRYLAVELAVDRLRVNAVSAGLVEQSSVAQHPAYATLLEQARARTPLGSLATAEAIAEAVLWLGSDSAALVTGQVLTVDGGAGLPG
jgi:enoyl-[acyl-carrier protein] reductase III